MRSFPPLLRFAKQSGGGQDDELFLTVHPFVWYCGGVLFLSRSGFSVSKREVRAAFLLEKIKDSFQDKYLQTITLGDILQPERHGCGI